MWISIVPNSLILFGYVRTHTYRNESDHYIWRFCDDYIAQAEHPFCKTIFLFESVLKSCIGPWWTNDNRFDRYSFKKMAVINSQSSKVPIGWPIISYYEGQLITSFLHCGRAGICVWFTQIYQTALINNYKSNLHVVCLSSSIARQYNFYGKEDWDIPQE